MAVMLMMDYTQLVESLLSRQEIDVLDFKRDQYRLETDRQKSKLIKDIICMANTPRSGSAYIVVGVETDKGRPTKVVGTNEHPDPAEFQRMVAGRVNLTPRFAYTVVDYLGVQLGLFEIPLERNVPVLPRINFGILRRGTVYTRRDGENVEAETHEITRIVQWAQGLQQDEEMTLSFSGSWEQLYRSCDAFNQQRIHIAVVGPAAELTSEDWKAFVTVGWHLVIDFDQGTDDGGGYSEGGPDLAARKSLRLTALDDVVTPRGITSSVWVAARGLSSRPSTIQSHTWREWNQTKVRPLTRAISETARVTEPRPATVVVFGGEHAYVQSVCDLIDQAFGERLIFVFAVPDVDTYSSIIDTFDAIPVTIPLTEVCRGLRDMQTSLPVGTDLRLPKLQGGTTMVPPDRARWVEEEFEIIAVGAGSSSDDPDVELRDFLRGMPITWYGLNVRVDVDRELTADLEEQLRAALAARAARRLNLWHWPGAGGSTITRRAAWNVHERYPTLVAQAIHPDGAVDRIQYLFSMTQLPVLVVVESALATMDDMDRTYDQLRSANVPVVFLQVERRLGPPSQSPGLYLDSMLSTSEAVRLVESLARVVPERRGALERLVDEQDRRRRTPFYFGLVAFGRDFVGLEPYVRNRLGTGSEPALAACRLASLAYHFGQQALPLQLFASLLGRLPRELTSIAQVLPEDLQELFVGLSGTTIRPSHDLVAAEMLEQLLSGGQDDRSNWRLGLADAAVEFIEAAAEHHHHSRGAISELVRAVIIERDAAGTPAGPWEGQFSGLITEIPSPEGQHRVLETLTSLFPDEPHFWAHLGRFHSRVTREHQKAHDAHGTATGLADEDSALHHMAGMAWRAELYDLLGRVSERGISPELELELQHYVEEAGREFGDAQRLDPRSEYNYVSKIQMAERVVGTVARLRGFAQDTARFLIEPSQGWYRGLVDEAENLLSELSMVRVGEEPSRYRIQARVLLDGLYGDYSTVIEGFTNLLVRADVYRPPVRRAIIRAYLSRRNHDWSNLTDRELMRISEMARQNLDEEPQRDENLRLWFRSVRVTGELTVERVAEEMSYRRVRQPTVDTLYYLYILKYLQADMGAGEMAKEAQDLINECSGMVQYHPRRTSSFEWLGEKSGLQALVHESSLGDWDHSTDFWPNQHLLRRVSGRVSRIRGPGSGEIELPIGLKAFFVPSRGLVEGGYIRDRDIGREVEFCLGFSYVGLRAWQVGAAPGMR